MSSLHLTETFNVFICPTFFPGGCGFGMRLVAMQSIGLYMQLIRPISVHRCIILINSQNLKLPNSKIPNLSLNNISRTG